LLRGEILEQNVNKIVVFTLLKVGVHIAIPRAVVFYLDFYINYFRDSSHKAKKTLTNFYLELEARFLRSLEFVAINHLCKRVC
jgi:hypothetical protein